ncbi:conserved hypothetical protein [Leishmania braziliensis MHOM/BR/75/M2904]|uniref:Uncharacterized protein n=3 Tax=Viannia TaxID=37616 RepID=A4HK42_LEIBR|nr:conserved hypothetical protein [Leishmania braziliensis MHOM/BR/75/M2904]CAJ2478395.1 unnamed protein product [Leishmania braziliensis]CAM42865.1 conserved hypothetical protein [Leishmania braziliensis MHOM/BR/75/M2904]
MRERERRKGVGRGGSGRERGGRRERGDRTGRRERGDRSDTVLCRLHRQRRTARQMREVAVGVFECTEGSRCKQTSDRRIGAVGGRGTDDRGRFRDQRGPSFVERGAGLRQRQRRGERAPRPPQDQHYEDANAAAWAPSAGTVAGGGGATRRRAGRAERKVWCALHGKHLPVSQCEFVQDCCYVCLDPSTCLATPLEAPAMLLTRGCAEVLCSKHHTLRSAGFVELTEKPVAYQCMPGHACRGVTVPHMGQEADSAAAAAVGGPAAMPYAMADMDDDEEVYMGARVTSTFLPQSGREAVSSFFM